MLPFPGATANVTATCATGFPFASFTITEGGDVTAVPAGADWLVGLFAAIVAAAPAVPVAVNVTGLPDKVPELAVNVFEPAVALNVQLPTVATPLALVGSLAHTTVPHPRSTADVSPTCAPGFPSASFTTPPAAAPTPFPSPTLFRSGLFAAIVAAAPAVPVAVNVTGLPDKVPEVAVNVFEPAVALNVQLPTVATPLALVV